MHTCDDVSGNTLKHLKYFTHKIPVVHFLRASSNIVSTWEVHGMTVGLKLALINTLGFRIYRVLISNSYYFGITSI